MRNYVNLPVDSFLGRPPEENKNFVTEYAFELSNKIDTIHDFARVKMKLSSDQMKKIYDVTVSSSKNNFKTVFWFGYMLTGGL